MKDAARHRSPRRRGAGRTVAHGRRIVRKSDDPEDMGYALLELWLAVSLLREKIRSDRKKRRKPRTTTRRIAAYRRPRSNAA